MEDIESILAEFSQSTGVNTIVVASRSGIPIQTFAADDSDDLEEALSAAASGIVHISEYVSDLLITYQKSFFDDAVDRFVEAWFELHPRHLREKKKERREINLLSLFGTLQLRR